MPLRRMTICTALFMTSLPSMIFADEPSLNKAAAESKPAVDTLARFRGTWSGDLIQEGFAPLKVTLEIDRFEVGKISGAIRHPEPTGAEGVLIGISATADSLRVFESIAKGRDRCRDGISDLKIVNDDTIDRTWIDPQTGKKGASGQLKRVKASDSEPTQDKPVGDLAGNLAVPVKAAEIDPLVAEKILILNDPDKGKQTRLRAFYELSQMGEMAAPALKHMDVFLRSLNADDSDRRYNISNYVGVGKAAVPVLANWVRSAETSEGITAIEALGKIGVDAGAAATLLVSVATEDLESIKIYYRNSDADRKMNERFSLRMTAVANLRNVGTPPELAVPTLKQLISMPPFAARNGNGTYRTDTYDGRWSNLVYQSIQELGKYGPKGQPAAETVIALLEKMPFEANSQGHNVYDMKREMVRALGMIGPGASAILPRLRQWLNDPKISYSLGEKVLEDAITGLKGNSPASAIGSE